MNIFPLKMYISVVVLLVEGSVQGAVRKKLINVSPIMLFKAVTLRKLEAVIEDVMQKRCSYTSYLIINFIYIPH